MLTFTGRRNMFGSLANTTTTANLSLADALMNDSEKRIISAKDWPFLWRQYTKNTVASAQAINLPAYTSHPQSVYVTVGSYRYSPKEVSTRTEWDRLNEVVVTSNIATHYFVYDGQLLLYPTPTSVNVVTFNARRVARDLSVADYTTGTITTVATAGVTTTVTGNGTTWHTGMIGRFIRITDGDVANTLSGDHFWYEIATVPSSTTLTLTRTYGGTAMAAASAAYTIGQVSLIPEPHDQIPVFEALKIYFTSVDPNPVKSKLYDGQGQALQQQMFKDYGSKTNVVLDDGGGDEFVNPNLQISL